MWLVNGLALLLLLDFFFLLVWDCCLFLPCTDGLLRVILLSSVVFRRCSPFFLLCHTSRFQLYRYCEIWVLMFRVIVCHPAHYVNGNHVHTHLSFASSHVMFLFFAVSFLLSTFFSGSISSPGSGIRWGT